MKPIPVGIQDFKTVREDCYYIDKSMLIGQILSLNSNGVYLITRPRRFGKSLNLSMLDAFFNIKYKGNTWFDGLEISKHPEFDSYKNVFPVIHIDFKNAVSDNMNGFLGRFNNLVLEAYKEHLYLMESDIVMDDEKDLYTHLIKKDIVPEDLMDSLNILSMVLERYHGAKTIVLIDEYDSIVNNVKDEKLRRDIIRFIKNTLSSLLKGNNSLQLGVMTGVTQIILSDDFGGLNNVMRDDILNTDFGEMYGFTDEEVKQICADYGHPEKYAEAKEWYGGYRFNESEVFNPWSILNYVRNNFESGPYWADDNSEKELYDIISKASDNSTRNLQTLISGDNDSGSVETVITFGKYHNMYSHLAVTGYLRAVPGEWDCELSIPNRELLNMFSKMINRK